MMSIKSIAIEVTNKAFLPESYAYRDYFRLHGFKCDFIEKGSPLALDYDAIVLFHGYHPFWKRYPKIIIGEYHSLSTGNHPRIKDFFKRLLNVRPSLYIFLNEEVRKKLFFTENVNHIIRGMGYCSDNLKNIKRQSKSFDIVYCGSNRLGLCGVLKSLAELGLSIALVGPEEDFEIENVISFGRKRPDEALKIMAQARYGLNYTPDIYPFNIQDSTKVIEYCAMGLGVITNRYKWLNDFESSRQARFLSLDKIQRLEDVTQFDFITPDVSDLKWEELLKKSGLMEKLREIK